MLTDTNFGIERSRFQQERSPFWANLNNLNNSNPTDRRQRFKVDPDLGIPHKAKTKLKSLDWCEYAHTWQNVMKKLKSMDMKYHWLRCRISQEQFRHYWKAGKSNNADYVTKHHPGIHHQATMPTFFTDISKLVELRRRQKGYSMTTLTKPTRSKGQGCARRIRTT